MKTVFTFIVAVQALTATARPLFGLGGNNANNQAAGAGGGLFGGLFGGGNNNNQGQSNGGPTTQSPAAIQSAVMGYANDVATVNKFIDQGMTSDDPGQLAQSAADAEADEIDQLKVLCPRNQNNAPSVGAGEACNFLQANTQPIVDMLQNVADVNRVQNPLGRAQMRQTMTSINEVRYVIIRLRCE